MRALAAGLATLALAGTASARTLVFDGHGFGHGVGMSQYGAEGLALHGWGYRRILGHYYPGTSLQHAPPIVVRVLVAARRRSLLVSSRAPFRVVDARGRSFLLRSARRVRGPFRVGEALLPPPLTFRPGAQPLALSGTPYRGSLVVSGGNVVNVLSLELYLRGVVPWEMPHRWTAEALKAQAVAARSYALATLHPGQGFDLFSDTRDQVYGGVRAEAQTTNRAIGATAGQVLLWHGRPALTYYFSTSGGRTAAARDVLPWAPRVPYLRSVSDPYDGISPHHTWSARLGAAQVARRLGVPGLRGIALELNGSGRVGSVVVSWHGGSRTIAARAFQHALGLQSTWFSVRGAAPDRAPRAARGWIVVVSSVPASATSPGGRVLRSDGYAGLKPGYWVAYRGPYATRAEAQAHAAGGYVRRLAP